MKTVETYVSEMEQTGILMKDEMTFSAYSDELESFKDLVLHMVMGCNYDAGLRLNDVIEQIRKEASQQGKQNSKEVFEGLKSLNTVGRELALSSMARKTSDMVARTLTYANRPKMQVYRNVYLTNGTEETELDTLIVTDAGMLILENKTVRGDMEFTEEGALLRVGAYDHGKMPIANKMEKKRRLLKECLTKELLENGYHIPVYVDSLIVLCPPKNVFIRVDNRYYKEKFCFRSKLNERVENFCAGAYYSDEQLEKLNEVVESFGRDVKTRENSVDFNTVRLNIATMLAYLQDGEPTAETKKESEDAISRQSVILRINQFFKKKVSLPEEKGA